MSRGGILCLYPRRPTKSRIHRPGPNGYGPNALGHTTPNEPCPDGHGSNRPEPSESMKGPLDKLLPLSLSSLLPRPRRIPLFNLVPPQLSACEDKRVEVTHNALGKASEYVKKKGCSLPASHNHTTLRCLSMSPKVRLTFPSQMARTLAPSTDQVVEKPLNLLAIRF